MKKNIPRLYIPGNFKIDQILCLSSDNNHYVKKVLKMRIGEILEIFNNTNYIFFAKIICISHKVIKIKFFENKFKNIESSIDIHLGQVICSKEKMDFTIQKSIEMGVNTITPLWSEYCNVKKNVNFSKKIKRWEKIAISACQQCHRNILPVIKNPQDIFSWCQKSPKNNTKIIFHPKSSFTIKHLPLSIKRVDMIVGAAGGFSTKEIYEINRYGFISIKLGPRILRTETAAIVAITALQINFGDLII